MKCLECRGACCETFTTEIKMYPPSRDATKWLELHAVKVDGEKLTFDCKCVALTSTGRCSIWADRPLVCELYIAGSRECIETVKARRSKADYEMIRDEDDPPYAE